MERVLITGGAGYLGYSIASQLLKFDTIKEVLLYDNLSRGNFNIFTSGLFKSDKRLAFVKADILDQRKLAKALVGKDTVFHLAAKVDEPYKDLDSQFFEQINNWGTAILANEILKSQVRKVIYSSSVYVYGYNELPVNVRDTFIPNSFYGISKLRAEEQLQSILKDSKDVFIFRIGNIFGYNPTIRFDTLINKLVFDAAYLKMINIYGEGTQVRPFIHVEDCSNTIITALQNGIPTGTFNLFSDHLSILNIVSALKKVYNGLEYRFVNRNMKMGNILVEKCSELSAYQRPTDLPELIVDELNQRI